jgi:lipoate-protein ligase A
MLYVLSNSFDPYFNLSTEEYLLKNKTEDIFMLWRSEPSVIIGKHQNALAELNLPYCLENKMKIARRLSGGGTVVHDLQNLNFTFISNGAEGKLIDFKRFVNPVIDYLATLGVEAYIGKTHDIRVGDLKVSGNAEHVYRKRTLHHGTLLFNSDLNQLRKAIDVSPGKYKDKAVQSNRSSVTNLKKILNRELTIEEFADTLGSYISNANNAINYHLGETDIEAINKLKETKYKTDEWIWSYSPKYQFANRFNFKSENWKVNIEVENGIIKRCCIYRNLEEISNTHLLKNKYHNFDEVLQFTKNNIFQNKLSSLELKQFCYNLF